MLKKRGESRKGKTGLNKVLSFSIFNKWANVTFKMLLLSRLIFLSPQLQDSSLNEIFCKDLDDCSWPGCERNAACADTCSSACTTGWDSAGPQWMFANWLLGSCRYHNQGIAIVSDYIALSWCHHGPKVAVEQQGWTMLASAGDWLLKSWLI